MPMRNEREGGEITRKSRPAGSSSVAKRVVKRIVEWEEKLKRKLNGMGYSGLYAQTSTHSAFGALIGCNPPSSSFLLLHTQFLYKRHSKHISRVSGPLLVANMGDLALSEVGAEYRKSEEGVRLTFRILKSSSKRNLGVINHHHKHLQQWLSEQDVIHTGTSEELGQYRQNK
ncbi:hypothetical protein BDP27DRAFT_1367248 [Rhodocollybia butyracea]|uniref:Uncharacterized protein n=1 Tax=Rhodocollybia butyracea TaxID=206335 RepID=A0A9P5U3B7_9AGAR|nr:hypothetical protein BDP27DRAFT_1367248 [Rhodocollybia butyracea]